MKVAHILDEDDGRFLLEYDNALGRKNTMRLDASTYENAIKEAKSFLEINAADCDSQGTRWDVE